MTAIDLELLTLQLWTSEDEQSFVFSRVSWDVWTEAMVVLHFIQTAAGACGLRGGAVLQYRQPGTSRVNCENARDISRQWQS